MDFRVVGAVAIVKVVSFALACGLAYVTQPKGDKARPGDAASQYGVMTLFCTGSNDLAVGLAIINALYPIESSAVDFSSITFVIVGMQVRLSLSLYISLSLSNTHTQSLTLPYPPPLARLHTHTHTHTHTLLMYTRWASSTSPPSFYWS